jgi:hypothetical protein
MKPSHVDKGFMRHEGGCDKARIAALEFRCSGAKASRAFARYHSSTTPTSTNTAALSYTSSDTYTSLDLAQ